jgi:GntR family transcriptional regulator
MSGRVHIQIPPLDERSPMPLYHQLSEHLRAAANRLGPDAPMPSEHELMRQTGVSRATARKAISDLVQEGLLVPRQGKGTFVAPPRVETLLERPVGFGEGMSQLGREPSTQVLSATIVAASAPVAASLDLSVGADVVLLERLRLLDGEPCMIERAHLPAERVPGLLDEPLDGSLYTLLATRYGLRPAGGTEVITVMSADAALGRSLMVPVGSVLFATIRSTRSDDGGPLEYTFRHARGDLCSFRVSLSDGSALADRSASDPLLEVAGT